MHRRRVSKSRKDPAHARTRAAREPGRRTACAASQEECRGWDVNEAVFSAALWPIYQPLMRADFTLFDEYEFRAAGGGRARPPRVWLLPDEHPRQVPGMHQRACPAYPGAPRGGSAWSSLSFHMSVCAAPGRTLRRSTSGGKQHMCKSYGRAGHEHTASRQGARGVFHRATAATSDSQLALLPAPVTVKCGRAAAQYQGTACTPDHGLNGAHAAAPFGFPITAFYGSADRRVTEAHVRGWARFTTGGFQCHRVEGHHLWPLQRGPKAIWLQAIADGLSDIAGTAAAAEAAAV